MRICRFLRSATDSVVGVAADMTVGIDWLEGLGDMSVAPNLVVAGKGDGPKEVASTYIASGDLGAAAAVLMKKRKTEP